jgi:hypothetical protein
MFVVNGKINIFLLIGKKVLVIMLKKTVLEGENAGNGNTCISQAACGVYP